MMTSSTNDKSSVLPPDFWKRIRLHREALGLTLDELSRQTGVSKSSIVRLENGQDIKLSTLIRVLERLNISLDFAATFRLLTPIPKNLKVKPLTEDEKNGWF